MNFDLEDRTIFLVLSGSRAYGMARPDSDYDYRGIAIPPMDSYCGLLYKFEQAVDAKTKHVSHHYTRTRVHADADMQVFELSKFIRLASQCNPSVIEVLFTDDYIICHPVMKEILDHRNEFITKLAKARFCGYALSQLRRLQNHKRWLDNPVKEPPTREAFGLSDGIKIDKNQLGAAEALIRQEIDAFAIMQDDLDPNVKIDLKQAMENSVKVTWAALHDGKEFSKWQKFCAKLGNIDLKYDVGLPENKSDYVDAYILNNKGFDYNFIELLLREKRYKQAVKDWKSYQHWLKDRNPERAKLEAKMGFDGKHASHLIRLLRMSREILETGKVNVKRDDAEELLAIRSGAWAYEQIVEFAEKEDREQNELIKTSSLANKPDMNKIHDITYQSILKFNSLK